MAPSPDERLVNLLAALSQSLADDTAARTSSLTGVSVTGTTALMALAEFLDGEPVGRLADVLGLTHSGAVRLVTQLESAALVRRSVGSDRRQVRVRLTPKGRRTAKQVAAARADVVRSATAVLSEPQRHQLERLVARVVGGVAARRARQRVAQHEASAWFCRGCDLGACGRADGRCPAARAAAEALG